MTINYRILNVSAWLAVLAVMFIPGTAYTEDPLRTEYGFPIRFYTDYHYEKPDDTIWFLSGVNIQVLSYLFNVLFIYAAIHVVLYIKKRLTHPKE
ncbi:hypothetical protein [Paenibacillus xylanilyticus]|uniref:hypothetical protein n=1 Tax=Paenibacillus xylanilyticus TaxID=248903 RepID=UPI00399F0CD4